MKNLHKNIGVFATSLLAASSAIYLYSPVIGTHAAENVTVDIDANINAVASLSLDVDSLNFSITPTATGVFESKPVTATVSTNSTAGYELYFSSVDNDTDMVNSSVSNVIASDFTGTVTSSTMAANKWGYSLNNTDFSPIPALNSQATLKNLDHYPTTEERTTTLNIGMKIDDNLPSGRYTKSVTFSVLAHELPEPDPDPTMQTFESSMLQNVGDSMQLEDERDGNMYTVKKLADGNVWMTENLRLINKTISSIDSNLPSGETYTVPASNLSSFTTSYNTNSAYLDSTYGGYYNFYTATAGWGTDSVTSGNSPKDICPKGWRLPTGGSSGEFQALYNQYNSSALMQGVPGFTLSGVVYNESVNYQGDDGDFWSSSVYATNRAYLLSLGSSNVYPADPLSKYYGFSVRCMAI